MTKTKKSTQANDAFVAAVGRALRKSARMHGTSIYIWEHGKVVAEKPRGSRMKQRTENPRVGGSIPPMAAIKIPTFAAAPGLKL